MKITKRQLRRIIREEKAKVLTENRLRRIIREATGEFNDGNYTFVKVEDLEPGDYVSVFSVNGKQVEGEVLPHGDASPGEVVFHSSGKTWDGQKKYSQQIHLRVNGRDEYIDFKTQYRGEVMVADPKDRQMGLAL